MPYFLVDGVSIYNKLCEPKFHLISFLGNQDISPLTNNQIENHLADMLDYQTLRLSPNIAKLFGTGQTFSLLLRPDNYIGFISPKISVSEVNAYLKHSIV